MQSPSVRGALLRALGATALALALIAAMIARLERVPRPRFEPVWRGAGGAVAVGRVVLARRGEREGTVLGWSVVCRGRELFARPGAQRLTVVAEAPGQVRVRDEASGREFVVNAVECLERADVRGRLPAAHRNLASP